MHYDVYGRTHATSAGSWLASSSWATYDPGDEDAAGAAGVREPRRPVEPRNTSGAALDLPHEDEIDAGRPRVA